MLSVCVLPRTVLLLARAAPNETMKKEIRKLTFVAALGRLQQCRFGRWKRRHGRHGRRAVATAAVVDARDGAHAGARRFSTRLQARCLERRHGLSILRTYIVHGMHQQTMINTVKTNAGCLQPEASENISSNHRINGSMHQYVQVDRAGTWARGEPGRRRVEAGWQLPPAAGGCGG